MVKYVILNKGANKVNVDIGLTQNSKKSFEDFHFKGPKISKCIISKISDTTCNIKLVATNSLNIEFENVLLSNKVNSDIYPKACIFSFKYFTREGGVPNNEWSKPDFFPEIEVILNQF